MVGGEVNIYLENNEIGMEYFLTKLRRVKNEKSITQAELRELRHEIDLKDAELRNLKILHQKLLKEAARKEEQLLEGRKAELLAQIKRADTVLEKLGFVWVGDNQKNEEPAAEVEANCSNENYALTKETPSENLNTKSNESSGARIVKTPLFCGTGFRLGTSSSNAISPNTSPIFLEADSRRSTIIMNQNHDGASRNGSQTPQSNNGTFEKHTYIQMKTHQEPTDRLPQKASTREREALKQTARQIRENMNKYLGLEGSFKPPLR